MSFFKNFRARWKQAFGTRLYRRIPANDIPVSIWRATQGTPRVEKIRNWSPGGLFVATKSTLPLETIVNVEFSLGERKDSVLRLEGQVVRHQSNPRTQELEGMGIMFTDLTQDGLEILRELLRNAKRTGFPPMS